MASLSWAAGCALPRQSKKGTVHGAGMHTLANLAIEKQKRPRKMDRKGTFCFHYYSKVSTYFIRLCLVLRCTPSSSYTSRSRTCRACCSGDNHCVVGAARALLGLLGNIGHARAGGRSGGRRRGHGHLREGRGGSRRQVRPMGQQWQRDGVFGQGCAPDAGSDPVRAGDGSAWPSMDAPAAQS